MKKLNRVNANIDPPFQEKVLQFGGGNFMRGFVDWMIDVHNATSNSEIGILLIKLTERGDYTDWQKQDGLYHILTRGIQNDQIVDEKYLVKSISRILHIHLEWKVFLESAENPDMRFVISNTTEAGIRFSEEDKHTDQPPKEFPAKLTLWLYKRYTHFNGAEDKGCIFLPVELILNNGENLRKCILQNATNWDLEEGFKQWITQHNIFCNTLVDRIVPGISREALPEEMEKLGFEDSMMTEGEVFHFWAIEGPEQVQQELPLNKAGLNVIFTDDLSPYRTRKVRILNGAHTSMVPVGYLYGIDTVRETVEHAVMGKFVQKCIYEEIIPTLDLPEEVLQQFAKDVIDRFRNPFIKHQLISIALNSVSKFTTRVLPSILEYQKRKGALPECLVFSMAALIHFYKGAYNGQRIPLKDDDVAIAFLQKQWEENDGTESGFSKMAENILRWEYAWKRDLSEIPDLKNMLGNWLYQIEKEGIQKGVGQVIR
jgi:tagaturonate reductase